jgi:hypothetical protein
MAATFTVYESFKKNMQNGTLDMDTDVLKVVLWQTLSGVSIPTASLAGSLTSTQVTNGNGYTTGGKTLSNTSVTISGSNAKFDADDTWWSANGGSIQNMAAFTIQLTNGTSANAVLVGWGQLSTTAVSITNTNRVTLQWASTGLYTVS